MHLFDQGWNKLREQIFENQKKLGVIPQDTQLEPWPSSILKNWDDLKPEDQKLFIRQAEIYAAYAAYSDHEIGRVVQAIEDMGKLDKRSSSTSTATTVRARKAALSAHRMRWRSSTASMKCRPMYR